MDYGEILARTWKIFWKFKILLLVSALPYLFYSLVFIPILVLNPAFSSRFPFQPVEWFSQKWALYLSILFLLVFLLVYLAMLIFSSAANSVGALQAERGVEHLSLSELLKDTGKIYWKVFGLYAIFFLAAFVVETVLIGCLFAAILTTMGMASICAYPFLFLLLPVFLVAYALAELSKAAIIVDNLGTVDGLKRGWQTLKTNFWRVIVMGLILSLGIYLLSMVLATPMYIVLFMPMFAAINSESIGIVEQSVGFITIAMAVVMPLYMAAIGILYVFVRNVWTLTYMRLTWPSKEPISIEPLNA
jgi:hypothetical protein